MIEVLQNEKLKMFCDTSFLDKNIKNIFLTGNPCGVRNYKMIDSLKYKVYT